MKARSSLWPRPPCFRVSDGLSGSYHQTPMTHIRPFCNICASDSPSVDHWRVSLVSVSSLGSVPDAPTAVGWVPIER